MDKQIEQEIINILDEQAELKNTEAFAGNVVKEEFHKGAIFGIKIISNILTASQPAVEADALDDGEYKHANSNARILVCDGKIKMFTRTA